MSEYKDPSLEMFRAQTFNDAHKYGQQIASKQQPATYTKKSSEISSIPAKPSRLSTALMPLALLGTSMAGLATHSWWVFFVSSIISWAALHQTEKFFETPIGKKVATALGYLLAISAALGSIYLSYNEWGWQGIKWSVIVLASLAAIAGLNHFFTKTEAGGKTAIFIAYLMAGAAFIFIAYVIIINS